MIHVSEIQTTAPAAFQTDLQRTVYNTLQELGIPFERVDTDEVITMEDCKAVNEKLNMKMVKTLFLSNRQNTKFYLFITCADKRFQAKAFSAALQIPRVSFASEELMETMLGTKVGAATVWSCLLDTKNQVQVVFDQDIFSEVWYGCSDGTTTGYMKVRTEDVYQIFLPFAKHKAVIVEGNYGTLSK